MSYADGPASNPTGRLLFYLTTMDPAAADAAASPAVSLSVTELQLPGSCQHLDAQDPPCAKLTVGGRLLRVPDNGTHEAEVGRRGAGTGRHGVPRSAPRSMPCSGGCARAHACTRVWKPGLLHLAAQLGHGGVSELRLGPFAFPAHDWSSARPARMTRRRSCSRGTRQ